MASWDDVATRAGSALAGLLGLAAIALRDAEAGAMAVGVVVALLLRRRGRGRLGILGLILLSANVAFWMTSGAVSNLTHGSTFLATALPAVLSVSALATFLSTVIAAVRNTAPYARGFSIVVVALLALCLVAAGIGPGHATTAQARDIRLTTEHVRFSSTHLVARGPHVSVFISNRDLFWHTFTIDAMHVDLRVPVEGRRRATFVAPSGVYRFVCKIPGHERAGMKGTLIVR